MRETIHDELMSILSAYHEIPDAPWLVYARKDFTTRTIFCAVMAVAEVGAMEAGRAVEESS